MLWFVLALALLAACSDEPGPGPLGNGIYIGVEWKTARLQLGHRVHVRDERIACDECHTLGADSISAFRPERCAACHAEQGSVVHAEQAAVKRFGPGVKADCTSCHAFRAEPSAAPALTADLTPATAHGDAFRAEDCFRCHAEPQGATPAVVVHSTAPCVSCHQPHADVKLNAAPCTACHNDLAEAPLSHGAGEHPSVQVCTTCHEHQHARAAAALDTCVDCHAKQEPLVPSSALFAGGHRACVGCHQPHAFERARAVACRTCHADLNLLGGAKIKQHQECTSCHKPHAVQTNVEAACAGCHSGVHPNHPKTAKIGQCVSCHDPHPAREQSQHAARACSDCHQKAATDRAFHERVECTSCHTPHRFVIEQGDQSLCRGCHEEQVVLAAASRGASPKAAHAAHQDCQGCHQGLPHQPKALRATCASCHAGESSSARKGHQECQGCHEPHSGAQVGGDITSTCATCHIQQRLTAPTGHQACASCHQPHTGKREKTCSSCHAEESKSPHGKISADCASCHRPHGPQGVTAPPGCKTCHEPAKLPGLHQLKQHQTCSGCHTGHGDLLASNGEAVQTLDRQACAGCHEKREDHFPNASCTNCHLFNPTR